MPVLQLKFSMQRQFYSWRRNYKIFLFKFHFPWSKYYLCQILLRSARWIFYSRYLNIFTLTMTTIFFVFSHRFIEHQKQKAFKNVLNIIVFARLIFITNKIVLSKLFVQFSLVLFIDHDFKCDSLNKIYRSESLFLIIQILFSSAVKHFLRQGMILDFTSYAVDSCLAEKCLNKNLSLVFCCEKIEL